MIPLTFNWTLLLHVSCVTSGRACYRVLRLHCVGPLIHDLLVSVGEDRLWLRPVASSKTFNIGHSCLELCPYGSVVDAGIMLSCSEVPVSHQLAQGLQRPALIDESSGERVTQAMGSGCHIAGLAPSVQAIADLIVLQRASGVEPKVVMSDHFPLRQTRLPNLRAFDSMRQRAV